MSKFVSYPQKYTWIDMANDDEEEEQMLEALNAIEQGDKKLKQTVRPSTLPKKTQELLKLIFDHDMFKTAMAKLEIDVKKLPLGALSKTQVGFIFCFFHLHVIQIDKGFDALADIEAALKGTKRSDLARLSSVFYTQIPHSFGRRTPPVISDLETVQKKKDMLNVLSDIVVAQKLAKEAANVESDSVTGQI